jgi:hypothetical protein
MQNEILQMFSDLTPQTLGMTDPLSIFGLALVTPGLIIFAILLLVGCTRPRWRGYWDAV